MNLAAHRAIHREVIKIMPAGRRRMLMIGVAVVTVMVAGGWLWFRVSNDPARLIGAARQALRRQNHTQALELARQALERQPDSMAALLVAGQASRKLSDPDTALGYLEQIPDANPSVAVVARLEAGEILLFDQQQMLAAEMQFRRLLAVDPASAIGHARLSYTLGLQSRYWDQIPHRLAELKYEQKSTLVLFSLSLGENSLENPELVMQYLKASPDDPGNQLAAARVHQEIRDYDRAEKLAHSALRLRPDWPDAHARLGRILIEAGRSVEVLDRWQAELAADAWRHPAVWFARGLACSHRGDHGSAARCHWEALRLDPAHQRAAYQLGQELVAIDRKADGERFLAHSARLEAYVRACELAHHLQSPANLLRAATHAEKLGLWWEAAGWCRMVLQVHPDDATALPMLSRIEPQLAGLEGMRMHTRGNPARSIDLSKHTLPLLTTPAPAVAGPEVVANTASVTFADEATAASLNFQYRNAGSPREGIVYMYEVVGGGVCVIDFDGDGKPDIHFPQGAPWPLRPGQREHLDRLFHNRGNGQFADVTEAARLVEDGFSQGGNVGDVDEDGFPDLFVANIGGNRLFHNNGDGTFEDITATAGIAGDRYTSSGLIADFNSDGYPDLYEVNYLAGDDLFTRVCGDASGRGASCLPQLFQPARDRCYLNLGDGRFEDISQSSGVDRLAGMGLGIVALTLGDSQALSLFVANDIGANFLLVNAAAPGERPEFTDQGLTAGVAYNRHGKYEASMGIAAGDSDGDGLIDLFVTNFDDETNTLYRQKPGGLFVDDTVDSGFSKKSQPYVGWGTQFVDGDLDGWRDLILTNGHVNDLRDKGKPFQMPAQYYRNLGNGQFAEIPRNILGSYFQKNLLGRGLARLDWNGDGREDVVISHLDAPAALLTNTTQQTGQSLRLRLRATRSSRDAIGAVITVQWGDRKLTSQLTAGDGNQSSNERQIIFGLGSNSHAQKVTVRWPSGAIQDYGLLSSQSVWMLIEGQAAVALP